VNDGSRKIAWKKPVNRIAVVITVLLLALTLYRADLRKIGSAIAAVSWAWLAVILLLNVLNTWVEALRWRFILTSVKKEVRVAHAFAAILVGVIGNTFLPFKLGDGARAYDLAKRESLKVASVLATLTLDRGLDVTFFLALVFLTGLVLRLPPIVTRAGLAAGGALVASLIIILTLIRFRRSLERQTGNLLGGRGADNVRRFVTGLSALKASGILLPTCLLSALSWGIRWLMVLAMFSASHLDLPISAGAVVLIFSNLGIAAVGTPANLGTFEVSTLAAFRLYGVEAELALSCALVFHMVEVIPMVLLGQLFLWRSGMRWSEPLALSQVSDIEANAALRNSSKLP
jgi:glycosyltransferase 2 family protein